MKYLILIFALAITACASPDYAKYAQANQAIETARHQADAAKYRAMADIAAAGDSSAKVAAVMALAMGGQGGAPAGNGLRAPEPNAALQWASVLVPSLTQVMGMRYQYLNATVQSNNARDVAVSTNGAFANLGNSISSAGAAGNAALVSVAGLIQAPAANITNTNTLSGSGTMGAGSYTTNANPILSGTGTLGSGAYSTLDTHAVDNHTVTPAPVVTITPVVQVVPVTPTVPVIVNPPVVITPVVAAPVVAAPVVAAPAPTVTVGP